VNPQTEVSALPQSVVASFAKEMPKSVDSSPLVSGIKRLNSNWPKDPSGWRTDEENSFRLNLNHFHGLGGHGSLGPGRKQQYTVSLKA
jgi:hypothetical protein